MTQSSAQSSETICPFSTSPGPGLNQFNRVVVSWKANGDLASHALVPFNSGSMSLSPFFISWLQRSSPLYLLIRSALGTLWLVAPSEELFLKPLEQGFKLGYLILDVLNLFWNQTYEDQLSNLFLIEEYLLKGIAETIHEGLFLKHVGFDLHFGKFLNFLFVTLHQG